MNLKKIVLFTFSILILLFVLNSCTKEESIIQDGTVMSSKIDYRNQVDPMTTNKVSEENGMLSFDTYESFIEIYRSLKEGAIDSLYYKGVYNELGYKSLGNNGEEYHEPENVVLEKFENRFSYNSLRKVEDNSFIDFLNAGNDPKDFNGSFILDETFRALLNENYEVKIENYYFKYIDGDNLAVVSDEDYSKIEALDGKSIFEVEDSLNLHIFNISDPSIPELANKNTDGLGIRFKFFCIVNFKVTKIGENTYTFKNSSFIPWICNLSRNLKFKWKFGDGTTFIGENPPAHTYAPNGYPYTVTLEVTGTNCCNKSVSHVIRQKCNVEDFQVFYFNENDGVQNGNYVLFKWECKPDKYDYHWDFGDGETYDGSGNPDGQISHIFLPYIAEAWFNVCLTVTAKDGSCSKTYCKELFTGCGHIYATNDKQRDFTYDGRTWRIAGKIWCKNNLLYNTVGAYTKSFRKGNISGIWYRRDADYLVVGLKGDFMNLAEGYVVGSDPFGPNPVAHYCDAQLIDETKSNNNKKKVKLEAEDYVEVFRPRFLDNHLVSYHKLKIGNVVKEIPALYLVN